MKNFLNSMAFLIIVSGTPAVFASSNDIGVIGTDSKMVMTYAEGSDTVIRYCSDVPVFNGDYSHAGAIKACPSEHQVEYVVGEGVVRRAIRETVFEALKEDLVFPPKPDKYDIDMAELAHKLAYIKEICPKDPKAACPAADGVRPRVTELQAKKAAYEQLVATYESVDKTAGDVTISLISRIRSTAKIEIAMPQKDKTYDNNVGYLITALAKIRAHYFECKSLNAVNEADPKVKDDPKLKVYRIVTLGSDLSVTGSGLPRSVPDNNQPYNELGKSHYWVSNEGSPAGQFTQIKNGFAFAGKAKVGDDYAPLWDSSWTLEADANGNWQLNWDIIGIEHDWMGDPKETPKVTRTSTPMSCKKNYVVRKD